MLPDRTSTRAFIRRFAAALLASAFVAGAGLTVTACDEGAAAGGATNSSAAQAPAATPAAGSTLFDDSRVHDISVAFSQEDYDAMIAAYKDDGEKEWISATVTIDGMTFADVGMRLKGNSSLRGLANGRGQGPGGAVSADDPQGLPWLIRLDKNGEDQAYDGITDIVIRSNTSQTALNEAVSLELLAQAGLASQRAIAVSFSVNQSAAKLRLATELPNDLWMAQHFSAAGALYKAEASGDYSYRGTDEDAYDEVFDQEAGKDTTDLAPLIAFLDFVNTSDDVTFAGALADRLDIDSFATYLAMEELIGNFDDIDGPGNNSYLYWDAKSGRFTVVAWDHNLALGGLNGPMGGPPRGGFPGGGDVPPGGPRGKSNKLVERFHADPTFEALYQEKLARLKKDLYESGAAAGILERWADMLQAQAADLVPATMIQTEATRISSFLQSAAGR